MRFLDLPFLYKKKSVDQGIIRGLIFGMQVTIRAANMFFLITMFSILETGRVGVWGEARHKEDTMTLLLLFVIDI